MSEFVAPLSLAVSLVLVAAIICGVALAAWRGWLELKQMELQARRVPVALADDTDEPSEARTGARIELAAVKERLRRLEAIANLVEL